MNNTELTQRVAAKVMERLDALGRISEEPDRLTRTFCSLAMRRANDLVSSWMRDAGMTVAEDALGNLIGRYSGLDERAKTFILGSHLDTVRDAGKYDGPLGVVAAIACVQKLHDQKIRLPFGIEVIAFADEEGVRYGTTFLGSRALTGALGEQDLKQVDAKGVSMAEAIRIFGGNPDKLGSAKRDPQQLLGYAEIHIEQGPVLEKKYQPVGVVTAISGQTRIKARFVGVAGHAGTTPMTMRHDALAGAAQFILAVESCTRDYPGLVATVGQIEARPGSTNVIPGEVLLSVDVRHQSDSTRGTACGRLQEMANQAGEKRGIEVEWEVVHDIPSVPCSRELSGMLAKAARQHLMEVIELPSGAGHDAAVMGDIAPVAMLFVRCKDGISHNPGESVTADDVGVAITVMNEFLGLVANQHNPFPGKKHA